MVYILSPLKTADFRLLDGISKVLIIDFNNNEKQTLNETKTLVRFSVGVHIE